MQPSVSLSGQTRDRRGTAFRLGGLVLLASLGCLTTQQRAPSPPLDQRASVDRRPVPLAPKKVVAGGACLELGEVEQPALTEDKLISKVTDLLAAERFESARRFICRYPDVAQETLRQATTEQASTGALQTIARIHDEQCGSANAAERWTALLQDRVAHSDRYTAYDAARKQFLELLHNGKAHEASAVPLTRAAPTLLMEIDAYEHLGEALLMDDKPANAATAFIAALKRAQPGHPYQAAQITLLLGEAQRRAGQKAEGTGTWQQAVLMAGQLLTRPIPVHDPILWERASYLRPVQCAWPAPVIQQLALRGANGAPANQTVGKNGLEEAWLWASIGQWRLDRYEPQGALVALKRAESLSLDQRFQEGMELSQARALAQLQQRAAALAVLVRLGEKKDSPWSAPALALAGGLKLQDGSSQQALAFFKKAVEESLSADWPGRGEAEADLGLVYLMTGDEANGLRWLHSGQRHFEAAFDHELLLQSLGNEANYLEHMQKQEEASRLRQRMKMMEAGPPPAAGSAT